jgi:hypothetical protein
MLANVLLPYGPYQAIELNLIEKQRQLLMETFAFLAASRLFSWLTAYSPTSHMLGLSGLRRAPVWYFFILALVCFLWLSRAL